MKSVVPRLGLLFLFSFLHFTPARAADPTATANAQACALQARMERAKNAFVQVLGESEQKKTFRQEHPVQNALKYWRVLEFLDHKRGKATAAYKKKAKHAVEEIERIDREILYPFPSNGESKATLQKLQTDLIALEHEIEGMGESLDAAFDCAECRRQFAQVNPIPLDVQGLSKLSMLAGGGLDPEYFDSAKCAVLMAQKSKKQDLVAKEDAERAAREEEKSSKMAEKYSGKSEPKKVDVKFAMNTSGKPQTDSKTDSKKQAEDQKNAKNTGKIEKSSLGESMDRVANSTETSAVKDTTQKVQNTKDSKTPNTFITSSNDPSKKQTDQREELELTLDDDSTSSGKSKTDPKLGGKELDPKIALKEQEKREAQAALERQKLLEKLKREFVAKAEAQKIEVAKLAPIAEAPKLTPLEEQEISDKALRSKSDLVSAGQKMLSHFKKGEASNFAFADYFLETETREKEEQGRITAGDASTEKFKKLYAKYLRSRKKYEALAKNTTGSADDKILAVSRAMNSDYLFQYVRDNAQVYDLLDAKGGNCVAETKFVSAVMKDLGLTPAKGTTLAVQVFDDHIQPVLYQESTRKVTSLVNGAVMQDLIAPVFKPEVLVHQYLASEGKPTPTQYEDFLVEDMPKDIREQAKAALAKAEAQQSAMGQLLGKLSFGTNSKLNFPKTGVFFERSGGFNPPPKLATIDWSRGASSGNARDYFSQNSMDPAMWAALGKLEAYEPPEIDYDRAQRDLRAALNDKDYLEGMRIRRDPTLLASHKYSAKQIQAFREAEKRVYDVLAGGAYVSGKNQIDGIDPLRRKLGSDNPELLQTYTFLKQKRDAFNQAGKAGDQEKQKYFELFRALGVKNWKLYKDLEGDLPGSDTRLGDATGQPALSYWAGPRALDPYAAQPDKLAYLANYQKETVAESKTAQMKEKDRLSNGRDAEAKTEDRSGRLQPNRTGFGNDPKGIKFKPEQAAFTQLEPGEFAQFLAQTGREYASDPVYKRFTPGLSAALRDKKQFEPEFVEWFSAGGYRQVADARSASKRVISGPDKKGIPKDVAVLLVDLLRDRDHTSADKSALTREIASNYGNPGDSQEAAVAKYIAQVKSEFLEDKKPTEIAKKEETPAQTSNLDVFKRLAKSKNIDPKVFDQAEAKSFEYKTRAPETFTMGSPASEPGRFDDESQRQVTLSKPYAIQLTPVTQLQWYLVMGNNPSRFKTQADADADHQTLGTEEVNINHPVEQVSWNDAQSFIANLNAQDGKCTYRLPTEAEYEAAARAKTSTTYAFGDDASRLKEFSWFNGNANGRTHAVATMSANPDGLYDMNGNVWAWTVDWYERSPSGAVTDPSGPPAGSYRVIRGGSWLSVASCLRSARRSNGSPGNRYGFLGFRLVRTCL